MKKPARNIYEWFGKDFRVYFPLGKTSVPKRVLNRAVKEVLAKMPESRRARRIDK